ncbi:MAG: TetR/AcrR family transcriptional regulator [Chloroflexi bacterium]|nr:TetR/AcrR family transcriptional regulator [Chloroflexota bacterium]
MNQNLTKKKAKQDAVYETAVRLFATKGYHATRIQDIADQLGMLKGSLYYYFSSKEDLLIKVTAGYLEEIISAIQDIVNTGYSPAQKLTLAIDEHLRLYQKNAYIYAIFAQENLTMIVKETAVSIDQLTTTYNLLWEQIIQDGIDANQFTPHLDVKITTKAILGMCNHTLVWYREDGRLPIREIARQFAQLILQGVST